MTISSLLAPIPGAVTVPVKFWFCAADIVAVWAPTTPVASKNKLGKLITVAAAMLEPSCTLSVLVPAPPSNTTAVITSGVHVDAVEIDRTSFAGVPENGVALVAR